MTSVDFAAGSLCGQSLKILACEDDRHDLYNKVKGQYLLGYLTLKKVNNKWNR